MMQSPPSVHTCITCLHYRPYGVKVGWGSTCVRPSTGVDLVTGEPIWFKPREERASRRKTACGPKGRYWEFAVAAPVSKVKFTMPPAERSNEADPPPPPRPTLDKPVYQPEGGRGIVGWLKHFFRSPDQLYS